MRRSKQLRECFHTELAILASLSALGGAACGTNNRPAPDVSTIPRQTIMADTGLLPGTLVEGSWQAGPNDSVTIELGTSVAGLDWDIHGHANGGTQEVASAFGQMTVSYDFHPTQEAQWYLLLRNSSDIILKINVSMDLYGQAQWNGWQ